MKACNPFFALLLLLSCREEENYPIEPVIKLVDVSFDESIEMWGYDTLSVTLSFTDGDGDLGLDYQNKAPDTLYPHHARNFFLKTTGELVPSDDLFIGNVTIDQLVRFSDLQNPPYDTLAAIYSGCNDTFATGYPDRPFFILNENHYNILIDFLLEDPDGSFVEFDWYKLFCTTYDGFFSGRHGKDGHFILKPLGPKKGQLTYWMISTGFNHLFGEKRIKLRVYIKDKALHNSNVIDTEPFILKEI